MRKTKCKSIRRKIEESIERKTKAVVSSSSKGKERTVERRGKEGEDGRVKWNYLRPWSSFGLTRKY